MRLQLRICSQFADTASTRDSFMKLLQRYNSYGYGFTIENDVREEAA